MQTPPPSMHHKWKENLDFVCKTTIGKSQGTNYVPDEKTPCVKGYLSSFMQRKEFLISQAWWIKDSLEPQYKLAKERIVQHPGPDLV